VEFIYMPIQPPIISEERRKIIKEATELDSLISVLPNKPEIPLTGKPMERYALISDDEKCIDLIPSAHKAYIRTSEKEYWAVSSEVAEILEVILETCVKKSHK